MSADSWMRITPRNDPAHADIHVCNKGKHRDYYASGRRLKWLIDWVRDGRYEIAPWLEDRRLVLEVYL